MTVAAVIIAAAIAELCVQEVARKSIVEGISGWEPSPWTVALTALAVASVAGAFSRRRIAFLFSSLFAIGLAAQLTFGARLQGDGFYYFAYPRSLAFDGDLDFTNDYRLLGLGDKPHLFQPTPTGYAQSAATVGPTFIWAPFFAGGHAVAAYLSTRDPNVTANGISFPYRQAVCVAGLFYGLLGCWFMYRLSATFFDVRMAAAAVAIVVSGSFVLWYMVKEPSMTHAPSMAAVAGFSWMWAATRERRTIQQWIALGAIAGFMTLLRWQNLLFAVLPAWDAVSTLVAAWRRSEAETIRRTMLHGLLFTAAATVVFIPQMLAWRSIYGNWFAVSPLGPQIRFADPQLGDILWSSRNGLLSTSPALYVGAIGLVAFAWRRPTIGLPMIAAVSLMTYFNASIQDWWGSSSFGGRRFDGTIPFFCLGLAQALLGALAVVRRFPAAVLGIFGAALVLWNLSLMSASNSGAVHIGEAASFGDVMSAQTRVLHNWFGNPFTYPASLLYSLRNSVSPSRYDLLSVNRMLREPLRPYGRLEIGADDDWVIDDGWHAPEREGPITFRWASGQATVLAPLDHPEDLRLLIRLHAFGFPGSPEQTMTVSINGHAHGPVAVSPSWHTSEFLTARNVWRAGVNRIRLQFGWERRPSEVGLGGDPRPLAAAVDFIRVAVPEAQPVPAAGR
jgi:hypothetical protein